KPENLKLTAREQIILLDFGLAKGYSGQYSRITTSGSIFGYTPNYAPLEQIQGTGTDLRSDFYSLAATLYNLLTCTTPPDSLSRAMALVNGEPDPLRPANEVNPNVPMNISGLLSQGMALKIGQRPVSAVEMRRALMTANKSRQSSHTGQTETLVLPEPWLRQGKSETDEQPTLATRIRPPKANPNNLATGSEEKDMGELIKDYGLVLKRFDAVLSQKDQEIGKIKDDIVNAKKKLEETKKYQAALGKSPDQARLKQINDLKN